jgi:transposase
MKPGVGGFMMLQSHELIPMTDAERRVWEQVIPVDHYLRRLATAVDFERFRPLLEASYAGDFGRPPLDVVVMLKLELLERHYNLSDRGVMDSSALNIACRWFLGLSLTSPLPHNTSMTYFRTRVGASTMQKVFDELVAQARSLGLVKDRLRLKDATHIIANIAIPSTIRLLAEVRQQLLEALQPFAAERVAQEREHAEALHRDTQDLKEQEQLVQRVTHLRAIVVWADAVPAQEAFAQHSSKAQEQLRSALTLAHKVLADRDGSGDKTVSAHDPDARTGKHGHFYTGYLFDMLVDADSAIITAVNVLPANGDEGADAAQLLAQEQEAHGNKVDAVSIDGAGYRGDVLRELTDPAGLNVEVFVPPPERIPLPVFDASQFTLSDDGTTLTCPAGQTTTQWQPNRHDTGRRFRFAKKQCADCPLRSQCLPKPDAKSRQVMKNDYEAEYAAAQAKARTAEHAKVRHEHPRVERKFAELVCRHDLRHARYRGRPRVLYQGLVTSMVVNMKRLVRLLCSSTATAVGIVRAELEGIK